MRMRGGSPSNRGQAKYWVRRHLDDGRRARGVESRRIAEEVRQEKSAIREQRARAKAADRLAREEAAVTRKVALWNHFEKIQNEIKKALNVLAEQRSDGRYELEFDFSNDSEKEEFLSAKKKFQEHATWINDNSTSISATALSTHITNAKRILAQIGKASGNRVSWGAKKRVLKFGEIQLDFSAPGNEVPTSVKPKTKAKAKTKPKSKPQSRIATNASVADAQSLEAREYLGAEPVSGGMDVSIWSAGFLLALAGFVGFLAGSFIFQ